MMINKRHLLALWTPFFLIVSSLIIIQKYYFQEIFPYPLYSSNEIAGFAGILFLSYFIMLNLKTESIKLNDSLIDRVFSSEYRFYFFLFVTIFFIKSWILKFDFNPLYPKYLEEYERTLIKGSSDYLTFDDRPLYSLFLYCLYTLFGKKMTTVMVIANVCMASFTAVFIAKLSSHFFPKNKSIVTLIALIIGQIIYLVIWDVFCGYDSWFNFWALLHLTMLISYLKNPNRSHLFILLLTYPMAVLSKETMQFFIPLFTIATLYSLRIIHQKSWAKTLFISCLLTALPLGAQKAKNTYNIKRYGVSSNRRDYHMLTNMLMYDYFKNPEEMQFTSVEHKILAKKITDLYRASTTEEQRNTNPLLKANYLGTYFEISNKFTQHQDTQGKYDQNISAFLHEILKDNPFPYFLYSTAKFFYFTGSMAYSHQYLPAADRIFSVIEKSKFLDRIHWFIEYAILHIYWLHALFLIILLWTVEEDKFIILSGSLLSIFCITYGGLLGFSTMAEWYRLTVPCHYLSLLIFFLNIKYLIKAAQQGRSEIENTYKLKLKPFSQHPV